MDDNRLNELKKRELDIKEAQEIEKNEQELLKRGLLRSGQGQSELNLIRLRYAAKKEMADERVKIYRRTNNQKKTKSENDILRWGDFVLEINSGRAIIWGKRHVFYKNKPIYFLYKTLLEARIKNPNDGGVNYHELSKSTGLKNIDKIRGIVRNLRKNLGLLAPKANPFQPTGTGGYRLVNRLRE